MGFPLSYSVKATQNFIAEKVTFPRIFIYSRNLVVFNAISVKQ